MALVSNSLAKANKLFAEVLEMQPKDPLAELSPEQRQYYRTWFSKFKAVNSATPDTFYEAMIDRNSWTPNEMLNTLKITQDMTISCIQNLYFDQLGK